MVLAIRHLVSEMAARCLNRGFGCKMGVKDFVKEAHGMDRSPLA